MTTLDVEAAFDKVQHKHVLFKMQKWLYYLDNSFG